MSAISQADHTPMADRALDRPVTGVAAQSYSELWMIVTHPAFRLGFLDAQAQMPLDHWRIAERIVFETPPRALQRLGYAGLIFGHDIDVAQYRYEEGRLAVLKFGLRCRAWGHPDFPPAAVKAFIDARLAVRREKTGDPRQPEMVPA